MNRVMLFDFWSFYHPLLYQLFDLLFDKYMFAKAPQLWENHFITILLMVCSTFCSRTP